MIWLYAIICSLACFRLALLVSSEVGPGRIFQNFRSFLKREAKQHKPLRATALHKGIECHLCNSQWYAAPIAAYVLWYDKLPWWVTTPGDWFLLWNAIAGASIILKFAFAKGF